MVRIASVQEQVCSNWDPMQHSWVGLATPAMDERKASDTVKARLKERDRVRKVKWLEA